MDVGVARADHHPVVAVEQQIAVETVGPGLHREEEAEQHRAVGNCCRRHRPALGVVLDMAVDPIDRSGEERAQEERGEKENPATGAPVKDIWESVRDRIGDGVTPQAYYKLMNRL